MSDEEIECEHLEVHTTYEDNEEWQGTCDKCGAELWEALDEEME